MVGLETNSYYFGLATAIVLGYFISSLRIERLVIAAIEVLQERVGGKNSKKQTKNDGNTIASAKETLPTSSVLSGWTEESLFELERRAIFSKTWLFITHASRFQKPGDYRTYDLAGFAFIIILGKDKQLRTFHNLCRHRAYAVTKKDSGSSTVLGCRYHGWSYDTKGHLIKAPEFDNVPGFDKGKNGLWEVKTVVREGMVFINFDARPDIEDSILGGPETVVLGRWGAAMRTYVADFKFEVAVNWKSLGFLDCVEILEKNPWLLSFPFFRSQHRKDSLRITSTSVMRKLASGVVVVLAAFPKSAKTTLVECTIVGSKVPAAADLEALKMRTSSEINEIMIKSKASGNQKSSSTLVTYLPQLAQIFALLENHLDAEARVGFEIHPAARSQSFSMEGKADDEFCKELEAGRESVCSANAKGLLDW